MEFKRLSDVEVVAEPTESANVLIEENGVIKKAPKTAVGGGGEWDAVIEINPDVSSLDDVDSEHLTLISGGFDPIFEKAQSGEKPRVLFRWPWWYGEVQYLEFWEATTIQYDPYENCFKLSSWHNDGGAVGAFYITMYAGDSFNIVEYNRW